MDSGLEDILEEADAKRWGAREIAVQVLARCCVEDGRFNNHQVRFGAVVKYLSEQLGSLGPSAQQAYLDLLSVLNTGGQEPAIRAWMRTRYP